MPLTTDNRQPTPTTDNRQLPPPAQPLLKSSKSPKSQILLLAAAAAASPFASGDDGRSTVAGPFDELCELGVLERFGGAGAESDDRWLRALDGVAGPRPGKGGAEDAGAPAAPPEDQANV